ncbi:N,N-dimethylformamidase beta subunit family domain-containing protein [Ensifer soli]|uniref:N,N-dimethylformamidase beta subunit family domain-containing protein n=1 Tax=Ciceribacter sp. sgz301302 TaxID=3342379 RepID=UPI0035B8DC26
MDLLGYFEEWSVRPGDTVRMAVSTRKARYRAVLERLVTGPGAQGESTVGSVERADVLDRVLEGRWQETVVGSFADLPLPAAPAPLSGLSLHAWIWPTVPAGKSKQVVWSLADGALALVLDGGRFSIEAEGRTVAHCPAVVIARRWYSVALTVDGTRLTLDVAEAGGLVAETSATADGAVAALAAPERLLLAARSMDAIGAPVDPYNGKIERPVLYWRPLDADSIAALRRGEGPAADASWVAEQDFASTVLKSAGGFPDGRLVNGVERAVTGHGWDGHSDSFIETPGEYGALQFHEDDMVDAGWDYDLVFDLPGDLPSGVYAVRLEADESVEHWPLFVMGRRDETVDTLFLLPTNTYLAYANEQLAKLDFSTVMEHEQRPHADDIYLSQHPELGRSCYDTHTDGSVCRYSSRRRPIIQVRPGFPNWLTGSYRHFPVDLYAIEWLERRGEPYHVATDEDLEREGRALLDRYKVVITGSHPEYWTRHGRGILDGYLRDGGHLMYLGGNGFYWVTSRDPARPWLIEVRRDNSGTRCWDAPAGERGHVYSNEQGGIWKNRGLGPHGFVGIGFCAEGWSKGCGYRRRPESREGIGATLFAGIEDEIVGDYGYVLGGAVGDEIDRYDIALGSPPHAIHLASSTGVGREYIHVVEEQNVGLPDQGGDAQPELVRSDIVYFTIGKGAVFSVGSMTVAGAIAWNGFDNAMARLVDNALDHLRGR